MNLTGPIKFTIRDLPSLICSQFKFLFGVERLGYYVAFQVFQEELRKSALISTRSWGYVQLLTEYPLEDLVVG